MVNVMICTRDICIGHTYDRSTWQCQQSMWHDHPWGFATDNEQGPEAQTEDKEKIIQSKRRQYSRCACSIFMFLLDYLFGVCVCPI